ncbi:MAG: hypothetical protein AB1640_06170 [bacterium]
MSLVWTFLGTCIMVVGSVLLLVGLGLLRASQESLGRMYLSLTSVGGSETPSKGFLRLLADVRGNDPLKKRRGLQLAGMGFAVGLVGAAIARL